MKIGVSTILIGRLLLGERHIIVDDNVDSLDINSTAKDIGSDHNSLTKVLETLVTRNSLLLIQMSVDTDGRELALY